MFKNVLKLAHSKITKRSSLFKRNNHMLSTSVITGQALPATRHPALGKAGCVFIHGEQVQLPPGGMTGISTSRIHKWGEAAVISPPTHVENFDVLSKSTELYLAFRPALWRRYRGLWVLAHGPSNGLMFFYDEYSAHKFAEDNDIAHESVCYCLGCEIAELYRTRRRPESANTSENMGEIEKLRLLQSGDGFMHDREIKSVAKYDFKMNNMEHSITTSVVIDTGATVPCLAIDPILLRNMGVSTSSLVQKPGEPVSKELAQVALIHYGGLKTLTKCIIGDCTQDWTESLLGIPVLERLKWSFDPDKDPLFTVDGKRKGAEDHSWNDQGLLSEMLESNN